MKAPAQLLPAWSRTTLGRLREIERDFHVRAFGEELARVNLDLDEHERRAYLSWMRNLARRHGVKRVDRDGPP